MSAGLLPGGKLADGDFLKTLIRAFATSATMNLTFGPTFMAVHKCSDTYLALRAQNGKGPRLSEVIDGVDWKRFVSFTLFKTVPIFWIPAHTLTFLLPDRARFFDIVEAIALENGLNIERERLLAAAERWATEHGGRSPRYARQFVMDLCAKGGVL